MLAVVSDETTETTTDTPAIDAEPVEIWARATINLPGLARGQEALVDPTVPYIGAALENRYLIAIDEPARDGEA